MLTFIYLILILGLLVFIHELGHYLMALRAHAHIYEFAIGMGPKLWSKTSKKTKIVYSLRLFPIGGYVQIAGEVYEDDDKIPAKDFLCNKTWLQRVGVMIAGVTMNFLLALFLLFLSGLIWGYTETKPVIKEVVAGYSFAQAGIESGSQIISINGKTTKSWDKVNLILALKDDDNKYVFEIKNPAGEITKYNITPTLEKDDKGVESYKFGFMVGKQKAGQFFGSLGYAFSKFGTTIEQMALVLTNLITGNLSINAVSGPVGMYSLVGESASYGLASVIYLIAILSINLGFINILPFPAFDGGHVLFLIIEKITHKKINTKIENTIHGIGFILLMILMILITIKDVINLF